jgi:hypothetical protein
MTAPPVAVHVEMDAAFFENADLWIHVHRRGDGSMAQRVIFVDRGAEPPAPASAEVIHLSPGGKGVAPLES